MNTNIFKLRPTPKERLALYFTTSDSWWKPAAHMRLHRVEMEAKKRAQAYLKAMATDDCGPGLLMFIARDMPSPLDSLSLCFFDELDTALARHFQDG